MNIVSREMKLNNEWIEVDVFYTKVDNKLVAKKVKIANKLVEQMNLTAQTIEGLLFKVHGQLQKNIK